MPQQGTAPSLPIKKDLVLDGAPAKKPGFYYGHQPAPNADAAAADRAARDKAVKDSNGNRKP